MKHQILINRLNKINDQLENLRMFACKYSRNCEECPFKIDGDPCGYFCGINQMESMADDIIDQIEENYA